MADPTTPEVRTRHTAEFLYPGSFLPESVTRDLTEPTYAAVMAVAPTDEAGYFRKNGWYAVVVRAIAEKRFTAGTEEVWVRQSTTKVGSWIVGEKIHHSQIDDSDRNRALIANIKGSTADGYGIRTRCGNWQLASDWDVVIDPTEVAVA